MFDYDTAFTVLKDFERVLDELDLYVYDNWENGDDKFLHTLYNNSNKENFHSQYLTSLFDALNNPDRVNNIFDSSKKIKMTYYI